MKSLLSLPYTVMYLDHTAKWSGGEVALLRVLEVMSRDRVRPVVVLAEDGVLVEHLRRLEIETHVVPLGEAIREVRKDTLSSVGLLKHGGTVFRLIRYAVQLAKIARANKADLIHTNSLKSDLYGALAGRFSQIPVIWHVRDHVDAPYLPAAAAQMFRRLARFLPQYVIANSQSTLETLGLGRQWPSVVVTSGLSTTHSIVYDGLDSTDSERKIADGFQNPVRIGLVGRLVAWKGQHIFLEAAAKVKAAGHNARFLIIGGALFGEQEYEAELRAQAEHLGLKDDVEFLGFRKDVPQLLRTLDILVHASTTPEPFGQVVIEGMAAGLPVVATNGGGVREIVQDGVTGLLVTMGDSDAMADALLRLLQNPAMAQEMARVGCRHVQENFTAKQSAEKLEAIYEEILARRGKRVPPILTQSGIQ